MAAAAVAYGVLGSRHPRHTTLPPRSQAHATSTTTSTTTALPAAYTAVSTGPSDATYAPATAAYSLSVGATSGNCWMSVTTQSGKTVFAQTLAPGTSSAIPLSGRATVLIGAPTVAALSVGGIPLQLPSGIVGPFTVTLVPG